MKKESDNAFLGYSQNFLKSPKLISELIDRSNIAVADLVYEIGPGKGIITNQLARKGAKVIGIEKDEKLYEALRKKFSGVKNVTIKRGDFLFCNLPDRGDYKTFSNIPFNLTADIITKLTSDPNPPKDSYLIVQKEAAERFSGQPYSKERQTSLLLKPWFQMTILHRFQENDFYPTPDVEIVLLRIEKRDISLVQDDQSQLYKDFIAYGLNQWKPTLKKALQKVFTHKQFQRLAGDLGFDREAKPTDLTFQQWLDLFNYLLVGVEKTKRMALNGAEKEVKQQQSRLQKIHRTRKERR